MFDQATSQTYIPPEPVAYYTPEPITAAAPSPIEPPSAIMGQDEVAAVRDTIQQYNSYPGVQSAFAAIVSANAHDPARLTALVREMIDQIEQVKANPHAHVPVSAEIAQAVEAIRKAELEKPDPLNLLRPEQQPEKKAEPENPFAKLLEGVALVNLTEQLANLGSSQPAQQVQQQRQNDDLGFVR